MKRHQRPGAARPEEGRQRLAQLELKAFDIHLDEHAAGVVADSRVNVARR